MKNFIAAVFIVVFGLAFTTAYAQDNAVQEETKKEEAVKEETEVAVVKEVKEGKAFNVVCPVSTEEIDDPVLAEYKGKIYGVCCKSCLKKFKKDPEKYISRLSEDGKKIVKKKES